MTTILIVLTIITTILLLILKSKYIIATPLLTLSLIYFTIPIYLKNKIAIDNLLILSEDISNIIKYVFLDILGRLTTISTVSFIISILLLLNPF